MAEDYSDRQRWCPHGWALLHLTDDERSRFGCDGPLSACSECAAESYAGGVG